MRMKSSAERGGSQRNKAKKMSKAQIQLALVKKKQCDARALAIVERLLEPEVSAEWLLEILEYLCRSHMEDVVEERSLLKRCGYPLCDKPLTMVITQRYHISTRSNKVYDVSRRKNFCSTRCYSAANYLLEQMLTSPLWSRDHQEQNRPQFQLLPLTGRLESSAPGVEIDLGVCRLENETDKVPSEGKNAEPPDVRTETVGINILRDLAESLEERAARVPNEGKTAEPPDVRTDPVGINILRELAESLEEKAAQVSNEGKTDESQDVRTKSVGINILKDLAESLGEKTAQVPIEGKIVDPSNIRTETVGNNILRDSAESLEKKTAEELSFSSKGTGIGDGDKGDKADDKSFESPHIDIRIDRGKHEAKGILEQFEELSLSSEGTDIMKVPNSEESGPRIHREEKDVKKSSQKAPELLLSSEADEFSKKTVDRKLPSTDIDVKMDRGEPDAKKITQKFKESLSRISESDTTNSTGRNDVPNGQENESKDSGLSSVVENRSSRGNDALKNVEKCRAQESKVQRKKREKRKRSGVSFQDNDVAKRLVERVERSLKEWVTVDTMVLLLGEEAVKRQRFESLERQDRHTELCRKLSRVQLEDDDSEEETEKVELKPLPDYSVLKEEGQKMELKVRAFFEGRTATEPSNEKAGSSSVEPDPEEPDNMLPMLDARTPRAIRRRIVLERLDRVIPDLLRALAGSEFPISNDSAGGKNAAVKVLVNTFAFSATNIVFKPAEWNLLALVIIKMLSMMEPRLRFLLSTRQALAYTCMILMSYKLEPGYLDRLVASLTDPTQLPDFDTEGASVLR